jgi:hypothetical protein
MHKIEMLKRQFPKSRFWELFSPNTITFGFWLATASFWFFLYQSLYDPIWGAGSMIDYFIHVIAPYIFFTFGVLCILAIIYLGITWLFGIRFINKKSERQLLEELKSNQININAEIERIEKRVREAENARNNHPQ